MWPTRMTTLAELGWGSGHFFFFLKKTFLVLKLNLCVFCLKDKTRISFMLDERHAKSLHGYQCSKPFILY